MIRLTQDGTAEPVSRDQVLRREWEREILIFPVQLTTSRIGNFTVDPYSATSDDHIYTPKYIFCLRYFQHAHFILLIVHIISLTADGPQLARLPIATTAAALPSCLWSRRIIPSLPVLVYDFYRDASSALLHLVN